MSDEVATDIVLCTMNAKWSHASFGLRCLRANLGALMERAVIVERTIHDRASDIVEEILAHEPRIVGIGVYVWNAPLALDVVRHLKALRPSLVVVVGGPEVSHEVDAQEICARADHVVTGEGELAFRALCERMLAPNGPQGPAPHGDTTAMRGGGSSPVRLRVLDDDARVVAGGTPELAQLASPYALYSDEDLAHRIVYVEASRGCPFTCEFCLSALDDGVRTFPLDAFLRDMEQLLRRGLRMFKFVDRTFNLKIDDSVRILRFFRERAVPGLFVHFEMIPDRLPDALRTELAALSQACGVQLEVGIQTLDDAVSERIARKQNVARLEENLRWLRAHTSVHVHADLIVGLPGEDLESFARGFDRVVALGPHEIQVGVLKRLRGAPIKRHDARMKYSASAPYEVLETDALSFVDVQRMKRFARYWDLVSNSGRFPQTTRALLGDAPFHRFLAFSDWLWTETRATSGIASARLAALLAQYVGDSDVVERDVGRDKATHLPKRQARHATTEARRGPPGEPFVGTENS